VKRHLTAPYSPQQNGVVERRNQTVVGMARCMLKAKGMPSCFWGEAVTTAVYVLNRAHTHSVDGKTPYEAWYGKRPAVEHLRVFGCIAHVKSARPFLRKLDDRSTPMVFIGYEPGSKAYRVYDPATQRVHVSRDVVFDEAATWDWDKDVPAAERSEELVVEYTTLAVPAVAGDAPCATSGPSASTGSEAATPFVSASPTPHEAATPPPPDQDDAGDVQLATPPTAPDAALFDEDDDPDELHRYRRVADLYGSDAEAPNLAERLFLSSA
jgi:hypothetical protein